MGGSPGIPHRLETPKSISVVTKPLPADAGRFAAVLLDILKYDVVGDIAAGRAEIAACP